MSIAKWRKHSVQNDTVRPNLGKLLVLCNGTKHTKKVFLLDEKGHSCLL